MTPQTKPTHQPQSAGPLDPSSPTAAAASASPTSPDSAPEYASAAWPTTPSVTASASSASATDAPERPRLLSGLSPAQITGGALAAATAAALGAKLGVAGTVLGAAFASLIINVGGKLYSETLRRTQHGISGVMSRQGRVSRNATRASSYEVADSHVEAGEPGVPAVDGLGAPPRLGGPARRRRLTVIAVSALASFVIAAALVTVVEVATGRGLDGSPSTTLGRVAGQDSSNPVKPGSDESQSAPATPTEEQEEPGGGAASQPPSSQPSAPAAPSEDSDTEAPDDSTVEEAPNDAPSAAAPPPPAQSSAKAQPPAEEGTTGP